LPSSNQVIGLVSAEPERPDHACAVLEKGLYLFAKRVALFAFDVNRADHVIADKVEHRNNDFRPRRAKAVRYRGSALTSPTFTVFREQMAAPVSPLLIGNTGYAGAAGPLQTTFVTVPAARLTS
jgi:hypothetical protein